MFSLIFVFYCFDFVFSSCVVAVIVITIIIIINVLLCSLSFLDLIFNVFYYFWKTLTHYFLKYSSTTFSFLLLEFQLHMCCFIGSHPTPLGSYILFWVFCCCWFLTSFFFFLSVILISIDYLQVYWLFPQLCLAKAFFIFVTKFLTFHRT